MKHNYCVRSCGVTEGSSMKKGIRHIGACHHLSPAMMSVNTHRLVRLTATPSSTRWLTVMAFLAHGSLLDQPSLAGVHTVNSNTPMVCWPNTRTAAFFYVGFSRACASRLYNYFISKNANGYTV